MNTSNIQIERNSSSSTVKIYSPRPTRVYSRTSSNLLQSCFRGSLEEENQKSVKCPFVFCSANRLRKSNSESIPLGTPEEIEREFNTLVNNEENLRISREILDILRSSTTANSAEDDEEENEVIERVKNPFFRNLDFENKEQ